MIGFVLYKIAVKRSKAVTDGDVIEQNYATAEQQVAEIC